MSAPTLDAYVQADADHRGDAARAAVELRYGHQVVVGGTATESSRAS